MAALLLAIHLGLALWSARVESATFDEVPHIASGYAHLTRGTFHLNPGGHPPLAKMLAGAALLPLRPRLPVEDPSWEGCLENEFGVAFLYQEGDGRALVLAARLPFLGLSLLLGLVVFFWAREAWGPGAGLLSLALYAFNPSVLAHAHYANSDLAITLLAALFLWGLHRFLERGGQGHAWWTAAAFALAAVTKLSFLLLVPMGLALVAAWLWRRPAGRRLPDLIEKTPGLLALAGAGILASWLAIWAVHGFRFAMSEDPALDCANFTFEDMLEPPGPAATAARAAHRARLLPEAYLRAFAFRRYETLQGRQVFAGGRLHESSVWWYFPLLVPLKTPLPLLVLAGWVLLRRSTGPGDPRWLFAGPALAYLALAMASGINLGYRHLLPALVPVVVLAGGAVRSASGRRPGHLLLGGLLVWQVAATLLVAPHFLSYFNLLAGGPRGGHHLYADSNCDWGQDLHELARLARREGLDTVKLSWFGNASPDAAGLNYTALPGVSPGWSPEHYDMTVFPGDVLAVSVTNLRGVYFPDPDAFRVSVNLSGTQGLMGFQRFLQYLDARYRPAHRAGYSVLVYRLEPRYERHPGARP